MAYPGNPEVVSRLYEIIVTLVLKVPWMAVVKILDINYQKIIKWHYSSYSVVSDRQTWP